ncbi:hypothetical protein ACOTFF_13995 [Achromobacter xylosoxidans]
MNIDASSLPGFAPREDTAVSLSGGTSLQELAQRAASVDPERLAPPVNAATPEDEGDEIHGVLVKFTVPMPEIKSDNEDDEVEMPAGLPMSVPMYVDFPVNASGPASTTVHAAANVAEKGDASTTIVPASTPAAPQRNIEGMTPTMPARHTPDHAIRRAPTTDTVSAAKAVPQSLPPMLTRIRTISAPPPTHVAPSPHRSVGEGLRATPRNDVAATAMASSIKAVRQSLPPMLGGTQPISGRPLAHEVRSAAHELSFPGSATDAVLRPAPRTPAGDGPRHPSHATALATAAPAAGHNAPGVPLRDAVKQPAGAVAAANATTEVGRGESPEPPRNDVKPRAEAGWQKTAAMPHTSGNAAHVQAPATATPPQAPQALPAQRHDGAKPVSESQDVDGPRHAAREKADQPSLGPWTPPAHAETRPAEPRHQQPAPSRPAGPFASSGDGASHPAATDAAANIHAAPAPKDHFEMTYRFSSWGPDASVALKLDRLQPDAQVVATASDEHVHHILDTVLRRPMLERAGEPSMRLTELAVESSTERGHKRGRRQR